MRLRPIIDIYAAIIDDAAVGSEGAVIVASIIEVNRWLSIFSSGQLLLYFYSPIFLGWLVVSQI